LYLFCPAHGLLYRILTFKSGINFASAANGLQRFRLLHHQ
jgi:hypothetical protein